MEKVSIIIPAHNEEQRLQENKTIEDYLSFFRELKKKGKLDFEIIVVLNACKDKTCEIVNEIIKQNKAKEIIVLDFEQGGKGFAITQGFKDALKRKSDYLGFVDADNSTPPEAFYDLVLNIRGYEGIIANRWDKKSIIKTKQPISRRILSRGYNFIVRSMFVMPYPDTQCGAKLFKKGIIQKRISLMGTTQWGYDVALLYCLQKSGARIKSIPTIWEDSEDSRVKATTPVKMFISLVRLRLMHSPFGFIVRAYNRLPEKLKIHKKF